MPLGFEPPSTANPSNTVSHSQIPTYTITRAPDHTLIFDPPVKSRELADALSYHYPLQQGLSEKIQQASLDFLLHNKGSPETSTSGSDTSFSSPTAKVVPLPRATTPRSLAPKPYHLSSQRCSSPRQASIKNVSSSSTSPTRPVVGHLGIWDATTGLPSTRRARGRKRGSTLKPGEKERVGKNRGNACDKHQSARTKCHQALCPNNRFNSCNFHRQNNQKCMKECPGNLLHSEKSIAKPPRLPRNTEPVSTPHLPHPPTDIQPAIQDSSLLNYRQIPLDFLDSSNQQQTLPESESHPGDQLYQVGPPISVAFNSFDTTLPENFFPKSYQGFNYETVSPYPTFVDYPENGGSIWDNKCDTFDSELYNPDSEDFFDLQEREFINPHPGFGAGWFQQIVEASEPWDSTGRTSFAEIGCNGLTRKFEIPSGTLGGHAFEIGNSSTPGRARTLPAKACLGDLFYKSTSIGECDCNHSPSSMVKRTSPSWKPYYLWGPKQYGHCLYALVTIAFLIGFPQRVFCLLLLGIMTLISPSV